jgi:DNA-binding FadR family transcriptional regulator
VALRRDALQIPEGTLLGREEELVNRYNVSRPTLRQAAGLVSQEQLITIRRGVGGGYFAARPDSSAVANLAAILLQVRGVGLDQMLHAIDPIRRELIQLAAERASDEQLGELSAFLDADEAISEADYRFRDFLRAELQHNEIIGRASHNEVLSLFLKILLQLVSTLRRQEDVLFGRRSRIASWRQQRNKMLRAVVARDGEHSALEARRCGQLIRKWISEDQQAAPDDMV